MALRITKESGTTSPARMAAIAVFAVVALASAWYFGGSGHAPEDAARVGRPPTDATRSSAGHTPPVAKRPPSGPSVPTPSDAAAERQAVDRQPLDADQTTLAPVADDETAGEMQPVATRQPESDAEASDGLIGESSTDAAEPSSDGDVRVASTAGGDSEEPGRAELPNAYQEPGRPKAGSAQSPLEALRAGVGAGDEPMPMELVPAKIRRYAARLVARHDLNRDGLLDPNEWIALRGDPTGSDLNADGLLSSEEIACRIAAYSRRRLIRLMPGRVAEVDSETADLPADGGDERAADSTSGSVAMAPDEDALARERRRRQFYVPDTRLPSGLPSWFLAGDANGDAQLSMAEFSAQWSSSELNRFLAMDTNGDGIITADEAGSAPSQETSVAADPPAAETNAPVPR